MRRLTQRQLKTAPARAWLPDHIGALATASLLAELYTWPKPGLVSHMDNGSHTNMSARSFEASADALAPFFAELAAAGRANADMLVLREIGMRAECAMLAATKGVNTHRGAIFGLGLLCAAAGACGQRAPAADLATAVRIRWGEAILSGPIPLRSHGTQAWLQFGAGGARAQAAAGFPHVLEVALPALGLARSIAPSDPEAWRVQTFFAVLATLEDTNLLFRGGADGLRFARNAAADFLAQGGIAHPLWRNHAAAVHQDFVSLRLSPGGCADVLAMALFLDALQTSR